MDSKWIAFKKNKKKKKKKEKNTVKLLVVIRSVHRLDFHIHLLRRKLTFIGDVFVIFVVRA